jgi:hypothetical protein
MPLGILLRSSGALQEVDFYRHLRLALAAV